MTTTHKLSPYFYKHLELNRRLRDDDHKVRPGAKLPSERQAHTNRNPGQSQTPARPRGSLPGNKPEHLTAPQRQALIDLVKANPDSSSDVVAEKFEEATGREVSRVTVRNYRRKITAASPQP
jgi:hypothetical protein